MDTLMKAARVDRYGPPSAVQVVDAPRPEPGRGKVLVRVDAASVNSGDARLRAGVFPPGFGFLARLGVGLRGPRAKTPGVAFAGIVERAGPGADAFAVGDRVAGMTGMRLGAHAQYVVVDQKALAVVPDGLTGDDAAAALFGGTTALYFLRDCAKLKPGQTVLVNGASGSVGSAAVQLAANLGAVVTAVSSAGNHPLLRSLGATTTVDYHQTPVAGLTERFDVVFDAVGNLSRTDGLRLATPDGTVVLAVAGLADTITPRKRIATGPVAERSEDFATMMALTANGEFNPLTEYLGGLDALPEAHRRIDSGRKVGNLVVRP